MEDEEYSSSEDSDTYPGKSYQSRRSSLTSSKVAITVEEICKRKPYLVKRSDFLNITLPSIVKLQYSICVAPESSTFADATKSTIMPPEKECDKMLQKLRTSPTCCVFLPYGLFNQEGIGRFVYCHTMKKTKMMVQAEANWFNDLNLLTRYECAESIPEHKMASFRDFLADNPFNKVMPLVGEVQARVDELTSICCTRPFVDTVMLKFIEVLNHQQEEYYLGFLNPMLTDPGKPGREARGKGYSKFIFILNVQQTTTDDNSKPSVSMAGYDSDVGNHFTFCVMTLSETAANCLYVDTLGLEAPVAMAQSLKQFLLGFLTGSTVSNISLNISYAHFPDDAKTHTCNYNCSVYPKQTCSTVGGPAVVLGIALCVLFPVEFYTLTETKRSSASCTAVSSRISHLFPDMSSHSRYLRFCTINWLVSGQVKVANVLGHENVLKRYARLRPPADAQEPVQTIIVLTDSNITSPAVASAPKGSSVLRLRTASKRLKKWKGDGKEKETDASDGDRTPKSVTPVQTPRSKSVMKDRFKALINSKTRKTEMSMLPSPSYVSEPESSGSPPRYAASSPLITTQQAASPRIQGTGKRTRGQMSLKSPGETGISTPMQVSPLGGTVSHTQLGASPQFKVIRVGLGSQSGITPIRASEDEAVLATQGGIVSATQAQAVAAACATSSASLTSPPVSTVLPSVSQMGGISSVTADLQQKGGIQKTLRRTAPAEDMETIIAEPVIPFLTSESSSVEEDPTDFAETMETESSTEPEQVQKMDDVIILGEEGENKQMVLVEVESEEPVVKETKSFEGPQRVVVMDTNKSHAMRMRKAAAENQMTVVSLSPGVRTRRSSGKGDAAKSDDKAAGVQTRSGRVLPPRVLPTNLTSETKKSPGKSPDPTEESATSEADSQSQEEPSTETAETPSTATAETPQSDQPKVTEKKLMPALLVKTSTGNKIIPLPGVSVDSISKSEMAALPIVSSSLVQIASPKPSPSIAVTPSGSGSRLPNILSRSIRASTATKSQAKSPTAESAETITVEQNGTDLGSFSLSSDGAALTLDASGKATVVPVGSIPMDQLPQKAEIVTVASTDKIESVIPTSRASSKSVHKAAAVTSTARSATPATPSSASNSATMDKSTGRVLSMSPALMKLIKENPSARVTLPDGREMKVCWDDDDVTPYLIAAEEAETSTPRPTHATRSTGKISDVGRQRLREKLTQKRAAAEKVTIRTEESPDVPDELDEETRGKLRSSMIAQKLKRKNRFTTSKLLSVNASEEIMVYIEDKPTFFYDSSNKLLVVQVLLLSDKTAIVTKEFPCESSEDLKFAMENAEKFFVSDEGLKWVKEMSLKYPSTSTDEDYVPDVPKLPKLRSRVSTPRTVKPKETTAEKPIEARPTESAKPIPNEQLLCLEVSEELNSYLEQPPKLVFEDKSELLLVQVVLKANPSAIIKRGFTCKSKKDIHLVIKMAEEYFASSGGLDWVKEMSDKFSEKEQDVEMPDDFVSQHDVTPPRSTVDPNRGKAQRISPSLEVMTFLTEKPKQFYDAENQLLKVQLCLKAYPCTVLTKEFPCAGIENLKRVILEVHSYFSSKNAIMWIKEMMDKHRAIIVQKPLKNYLKADPVLRFEPPDELVLLIPLKGVPECVEKRFPCTEEGFKDPMAMKTAITFVKDAEVKTWLAEEHDVHIPHDEEPDTTNVKKTKAATGHSVKTKKKRRSEVRSRNDTPVRECPMEMPDRLVELLSKDPVCIFDEEENKLRLNLQLNVDTSAKFTREFPCDGEDSVEMVQEFLDSEEAYDWLKGLHSSFRSISVPKNLRAFLVCNPLLQYCEPDHIAVTLNVRKQGSVKREFPCSQLGFDDVEAMSAVTEFVNGQQIYKWLQEEKGICIELDFDNATSLKDLLDKPYTLRFANPGTIRMRCAFKNGKTVFKGFPSSSEGLQDEEAMARIDAFVNGRDGIEWARKNASFDDAEGRYEWVEAGTLAVGLETRWFFDNFKFNVKNAVVVQSKKIERSVPNTSSLSVRKSSTWGMTHRTDETYSLTGPVDPGSILVSRTVSCSGGTSVCRVECGAIRNQLDLPQSLRYCPSCNMMLYTEQEMHQCANCGVLSGSRKQWGRIEGLLMCNPCTSYRRKSGRFRPKEAIEKLKSKMKCEHQHTQCGWKMKLVLHSDDLNTWKVFKGRHNDFFHQEEAVQPSKRPSLSQRDLWDQQILAAGHATKTSLIAKKIRSMGDNKASLKKIRDRLKRIKQSRNVQLQITSGRKAMRKRYKLEKPPTGVVIPKVEAIMEVPESDQEDDNDVPEDTGTTENVENVEYDGMEVVPETVQVPEAGLETISPEVLAQLTQGTEGQKIVILQDHIMCSMCMAQKMNPPFTGSSSDELFKHISRAHQIKLFSCTSCWNQGALVSFETEHDLTTHVTARHALSGQDLRQQIASSSKGNNTMSEEVLSAIDSIINADEFVTVQEQQQLGQNTLKRKATELVEIKTEEVDPKRVCVQNDDILRCAECTEVCNTRAMCCDHCHSWYHWQCISFTQDQTNGKWFCMKCLPVE